MKSIQIGLYGFYFKYLYNHKNKIEDIRTINVDSFGII